MPRLVKHFLATTLNSPSIKPHFIAVSFLASLAFVPRTTKSLKLVFVDFFQRLCLLYDNRCSFRRGSDAVWNLTPSFMADGPSYKGTWFSEPMSFLIVPGWYSLFTAAHSPFTPFCVTLIRIQSLDIFLKNTLLDQKFKKKLGGYVEKKTQGPPSICDYHNPPQHKCFSLETCSRNCLP